MLPIKLRQAINCKLYFNFKDVAITYSFLRFAEVCRVLHLFCSCWCCHPDTGIRLLLFSVLLVSPPAYSGYNLAVVLPPGLYRITEHSGQYRLQLAHGIKSELLSLAFRPSHLYSYLFRGIF